MKNFSNVMNANWIWCEREWSILSGKVTDEAEIEVGQIYAWNSLIDFYEKGTKKKALIL